MRILYSGGGVCVVGTDLGIVFTIDGSVQQVLWLSCIELS